MGDAQTAGLTGDGKKWIKGFTGKDPDQPKAAGAPAPAAAADGAAAAGPPGGGASGGPLVDPPVPKDSPASKAKFVKAVQAFISAITPSTTASGLYDVAANGKVTQISQNDYDAALKKLADRIRDLLDGAFRKAEGGIGLYNQKKKTDNEWWITSHIVNTLGRVKDPGPFLTGAYADATKFRDAALSALGKPDLVAAASAMAECEYASVKTHLLAQAYFEATISAGELQVAVLEGVEQGCEWSIAFLGIVATGGAALGLEAGGSAVVVGGVGATAATGLKTANKAALGQPINWAEVSVDWVMSLVFARFGDGLGKAVGEGIIGEVTAQYGAKYAKAAIEKAAAEIVKVTLTKVISATIAKLKPGQKQMTGEELAGDIAKELQGSGSLQTEMVKAVIETLSSSK